MNEIPRILTKIEVLTRHVPIPIDPDREEAFDAILGLLSLQQFPPDQTIISQGDPGNRVDDQMYFIAAGEVEVRMRIPELEQPKSIAFLKTGDVVGEMAFVNNESRTADVVTITDVKAYALSRRSWEDIKIRYPAYVARIIGIARTRQQVNQNL